MYNGHPYHVPCLVRSLQCEVDAARERYEGLRPHVSDRSVLRGLCRFADVAETEGQAEGDDARNALDWLRQSAGWKSEKGIEERDPKVGDQVLAVNQDAHPDEIGVVVRNQGGKLPHVVRWPNGCETGYATHEIRSRHHA